MDAYIMIIIKNCGNILLKEGKLSDLNKMKDIHKTEVDKAIKGLSTSVDDTIKDLQNTISKEDDMIIKKIDDASKDLESKVVEIQRDNNKTYSKVYKKLDENMEKLNDKFLRKNDAAAQFKPKD